jgi:hypothetical protein
VILRATKLLRPYTQARAVYGKKRISKIIRFNGNGSIDPAIRNSQSFFPNGRVTSSTRPAVPPPAANPEDVGQDAQRGHAEQADEQHPAHQGPSGTASAYLAASANPLIHRAECAFGPARVSANAHLAHACEGRPARLAPLIRTSSWVSCSPGTLCRGRLSAP